MIDRVREQFDNDVVIYHSKLTTNERFYRVAKINSGKVKVAIGTRSAFIFAF